MQTSETLGVATPFTWSVLSQFSELGFRRAFGAMGCAVPRDAELVGDFRGRIYLNLTEFQRDPFSGSMDPSGHLGSTWGRTIRLRAR